MATPRVAGLSSGRGAPTPTGSIYLILSYLILSDTYREDREKRELSWENVRREHLQFGQYKKYTFLPDESCEGCQPTDTGFRHFCPFSISSNIFTPVRMLNMPAASFIAKIEREVHSISAGVYAGLNDIFNDVNNEYHDEIFKEIVVDEFLFR